MCKLLSDLKLKFKTSKLSSIMPTTEKVITTKKIVSIDNQPNHEFDQLLVNRTVNNQTTKRDSIEDDLVDLNQEQLKPEEKVLNEEFRVEYAWRNIIFFIFMHLCVPYAFIVGALAGKYYLVIWHAFLGYMAGLGVTAGAHRLWSHQSYKAHWTVRLFLAFWFTVAGQNDIYEWCRDHRVHHKWSETDADPHNSNRGFFFAHMGWLCCKKHPLVISKGSTLDFNDLLKDPIVRYHKKYYKVLYVLCVYLIPTYATVKLFGETWEKAFIKAIVRYCLSLHITWLVNSAAHMFGTRPYNDKINPRESPIVIYLNVLGEGFHNYHHTFPYDYRSSEFGYITQLNVTCLFIDTLARLGLAWDLRKASDKIVESSKNKVEANARLREKLGEEQPETNDALKDHQN